MSGRERKNEFLVEMYTLEEQLLRLHEELEIIDEKPLSRIMIHKIVEFEGDFGDLFYETMIGNFFLELFLEEAKCEIANLEKEKALSLFVIFLRTFILNRSESFNYIKFCGWLKESKLTDYREYIVKFIENFIGNRPDLAEERKFSILANIRAELAMFVDYEFAEAIMNEYDSRVQKAMRKVKK